jgi:hypothetical protein
MNDKDKIIEGILKSKIEIIADRNLRFAMIQDELQELKGSLTRKLEEVRIEILEFIRNEGQ